MSEYNIPDGLEKKFIIRPDGKYRSMEDVIEQTEQDDPEAVCLSANRDFLVKAGCETEGLIEEAWEMLKTISPEKSFTYWENDSGSGVTCKKLISEAEKPGAFLALIALLRKHVDAQASGELTISWRNSAGSSQGRPQGRR